MKKGLLILALSTLLFGSCFKHEVDEGYLKPTQEQINQNVKNIFGVDFDATHDWKMTNSGIVTITNIPSSIDRVQLLVCVNETDTTTSISVLNEKEVEGESTITLAYDAPKENIGLYVAFISSFNFNIVEVNGETVSYGAEARTRANFGGVEVPDNPPSVTNFVTSFAKERGWNPNDKLYELSHYSRISAAGYSPVMETIFRNIVFSYFKNGRSYNNLPLVKSSGIYNDNAYPITTGNKPILVSPVYKRDAATKYGNEVYNSDLYYYYYKDGAEVNTAYLESLPKYKAIPFNEHFGVNEDDVIQKRASYVLAYFGDGIPTEGTQGTYQFPEGYKIGFMVRAKTTSEAPKKQGELYGDGRLNAKINSWPNFSSSKLGSDGPRIAWLTINDRMMMCWESGTDSDFNDIILEVEGGVKPIIFIPDIESQIYTFCFEDTPLGDYDLNDVVIKAKRLSPTQVEYSVIACGAHDEIYIGGTNGRQIDNREVHSMFGMPLNEYINTQSRNYNGAISEVVTVKESFSFLDEASQPYIVDKTIGITTRVSTIGQDPHGIMIPSDFRYPLEKICVKDAYKNFNNWGRSKVTSTDWYLYPTEGKVWNY